MECRRKFAVEILDVNPTIRDEILEVIVKSTGKPLRLRRDEVEFFPGKVIMPLWLAEKLGLSDGCPAHIPSSSRVEFCGELKKETTLAYLIFDGVNDIWIPKKLVAQKRQASSGSGNDIIIEIPSWLAKKKGIV